MNIYDIERIAHDGKKCKRDGYDGYESKDCGGRKSGWDCLHDGKRTWVEWLFKGKNGVCKKSCELSFYVKDHCADYGYERCTRVLKFGPYSMVCVMEGEQEMDEKEKKLREVIQKYRDSYP